MRRAGGVVAGLLILGLAAAGVDFCTEEDHRFVFRDGGFRFSCSIETHSSQQQRRSAP